MRRLMGALTATAGLCAAGAAAAAPSVEIRNAAVRVIVTPEARGDVRVEIAKSNPRLPLKVWSFAGRTYIDGGLSHRIRTCGGEATSPHVSVWGAGDFRTGNLPLLLIHTPMDAKVSVGGAVFGQVGRSGALELANAGCGSWQVANVRGRLKISQAGSGAMRAGQSGSAELYSAGSGVITTREVSGSLLAVNLGSGDIDVAAVNGPFNARIAGSGRVRVAGGHAGAMEASIAGSGDVALDGVAASLKATIMGSGDVRVAKVTGPVTKAVMGSGVVRVGS